MFCFDPGWLPVKEGAFRHDNGSTQTIIGSIQAGVRGGKSALPKSKNASANRETGEPTGLVTLPTVAMGSSPDQSQVAGPYPLDNIGPPSLHEIDIIAHA